MGFWLTSLILTYNYLNNFKPNLILLWMKMTYETPVKNEDDYNVIGLSQDMNKDFWSKEDAFNHQYNRVLGISSFIANIVFGVQTFLNSYDVHMYTFVIVSTVHAIHSWIFIYLMFHIMYTFNIFFLTMLNFFSLKFGYITEMVERLTRQSNSINQDLSQLIYEFNYVYFELIQINMYFKYLSGFNLIYFFLIAVLATFAFVYMDLNIKITGYLVLSLFFIIILYLPFQWANKVTAQVSLFENLLQSFTKIFQLDEKNKSSLSKSIVQICDLIGKQKENQRHKLLSSK